MIDELWREKIFFLIDNINSSVCLFTDFNDLKIYQSFNTRKVKYMWKMGWERKMSEEKVNIHKYFAFGKHFEFQTGIL